MSLAFVPGVPSTTPRLLGRFLPPLAEGVAAHYVHQHSRPGGLVFDPYGTSPAVALEALRLERRVIVATLNPVTRLVLSLAVRPPSVPELRAALTRLGDAPTGRGPADRLEWQVTALYATRCGTCEGAVTADYYDWEVEAGEPVEKGYVCLKCGPATMPADDLDREAARRHSRTGPDYHYLLGRVAGVGDVDRGHAIEALEVYPPRTLAAIGAILVKLDSLDASRETHRLLAGLLVAAFDAATILAQERPKVLVTPRRFREVNFWLALEGAVGLLAGAPAPDRSLPLDELLAGESAGIHAFAGSVRDAAAALPPASCPLILTALPRPNQALWTLSAVWAAWLWGAEAAEPVRSVLRRRRYDWTWHARALHRTLSAALPALAPDGRVVALLPEAEPGFCAAALAAGQAAGLAVKGAALRADSGEAQIVWAAPAAAEDDETLIWDKRPPADAPPATAPGAMAAALRARSEPSRWTTLHFAAWLAAVERGGPTAIPDDLIGPANRAIEAAAKDSSLFVRLGAEPDSEPSTGLWWLKDQPGLATTLADRVEAAVRDEWQHNESFDEHDLLPRLYAAFPGVETPGRALVMACLAAYGEHVEAGLWRRRPEDSPEKRSAEVAWMLAELRALAVRLAFEVTGGNPLVWAAHGHGVYVFAVLSTAELGPVLLGPPVPAQRRRYLIFPGGRAGLAEVKLRRDPRLRLAMRDARWTVVKYRQLRRVAGDPALSRDNLERALAGDPLAAAQQLALGEEPMD